jgi:hypothetical protein
MESIKDGNTHFHNCIQYAYLLSFITLSQTETYSHAGAQSGVTPSDKPNGVLLFTLRSNRSQGIRFRRHIQHLIIVILVSQYCRPTRPI